MKKLFFSLSIALLGGFLTLNAQEISRVKTFPVTGYSVSEMGYPFQLVPGEEDGFVYVEFWIRGGDRKFPNYYIQGYNNKFEEEWFSPVTEQNAPEMKPLALFRFKDNIGLVGLQNDLTIKGVKAVMQLYEPNGDHVGGLTEISNFDKKSKKGFETQLYRSPDSTKMLWLGTNPEEGAKKRRYLATAWSQDGRSLWKADLPLAPTERGYEVRQTTVDNKGNAYFLMTYETVTNTEKDTVNLPVIVRYDHRERKFSEYQLEFPGASVPEGRIKVTRKGDLVFVGILADGSEKGFLNGAKSQGVGLTWNKIVFKHFDIERELKLQSETLMDIPESWLTKYGNDGANFSKHEMREVDGKLFWILEENYTQTHNGRLQHLFYDVAIVALDLGTSEISWATSFEKQQRDYERGNLLSYVLGVAGGKLRFVYLNERGAQGKILCQSVNMKNGEVEEKTLVRNEKADFLFFPRRSSMIGPNKMMLMGVGNPVGNDYKLIEIAFPQF